MRRRDCHHEIPLHRTATVPHGLEPDRFGGLALLLLLQLLAHTLLGPPPAWSSTAASPATFRSDDYVLHRLEPGETASTLAAAYLGDPARSWQISDANENTAFAPGEWIVVPLRPRKVWHLTPDSYQTVPILTYHRFAKACHADLCMPEKAFEEQARYLFENGFHTIDFQAFADFYDHKAPIPKKSVIITVDDGYRSVYDIAYPILRKYGFRATLFVYTDFVSASANAVTWQQLAEMKRHGFEVGSHTLSHANLLKINPGEQPIDYHRRIMKELQASKSIIDRKLEQDTIVLAYPYGNYNPEIVKMSQSAGYRFAVTIKGGTSSFLTKPFVLRRNSVFSRDVDALRAVLRTINPLSLR